MTLNDFLHLPKLHKVKKIANGYTARCPAHQDKENSLSLSETSDKILLNCFTGCDAQAIVSALDLTMKDLFFESYQAKQRDDKRAYKPNTAQKIVAAYPYTAENGELLYENVRFEPKDFRQRCYDENGREVWSLNGTRRVPYRLPELIEAVRQGADIFLCEGEIDTDALIKLGLSATNFKNWKPEFNQFIKGANVILSIDHDISGVKQAADVCKLLSGKTDSLKLIDLFADEPLPEKHGRDVSDWIQIQKEQGLSDEEIAERLCILTDNATVWQPNKQEIKAGAQETDADIPSLFIVKSANAWIAEARLKPMPKKLFDEFWFEGEVCILFGDTGKGKTALAVQINDVISRSATIGNFHTEAQKQKILYFDFELSDKQFEKRYSVKQGDAYTNHFIFDENFKRVEINRYASVPKRFRDFESYLLYSLEVEINNTEARILTVDNITFLKNGTETAKDALPLMKELINLKMKYSLSLMALAHTPKRDLSKPITINDLQGSKMLGIFADSIFAVGESAKDKNLRYLKQIKTRNGECIFDSENVAVCQLAKPDNFLMFEFLSYGSEREHLKQMTDGDKKDLIEKAKNLSDLGESQRKIASELGISLGAVNKYLNK